MAILPLWKIKEMFQLDYVIEFGFWKGYTNQEQKESREEVEQFLVFEGIDQDT